MLQTLQPQATPGPAATCTLNQLQSQTKLSQLREFFSLYCFQLTPGINYCLGSEGKRTTSKTSSEEPFVLLPQAQLQFTDLSSTPFYLNCSWFPLLLRSVPPSTSVTQCRRQGSARHGFSATPCLLLIFPHCWMFLYSSSALADVPALKRLTYRLQSLWQSLCPSMGLPWAAASSGVGHPQAAVHQGVPQVTVPSGVCTLALAWLACMQPTVHSRSVPAPVCSLHRRQSL